MTATKTIIEKKVAPTPEKYNPKNKTAKTKRIVLSILPIFLVICYIQ
jgi:hypothetical protein